MSTVKTELCNLALHNVGASKRIADVDENSTEARACKAFYNIVYKTTLRDFDWPFAHRTVTLALVAENPTDKWAYSYRYPVGCLYFRRIWNGFPTDNQDNRIPYEISSDDTGLLILTNQPEAVGEYTHDMSNEALWPYDFQLAFTHHLGHYIAPQVTGGDPFGLGKQQLSLYSLKLGQARANALNEQKTPEDTTNGFERARGGY